MQGAWVWSLVRELKPYMLHDQAEKKIFFFLIFTWVLGKYEKYVEEVRLQDREFLQRRGKYKKAIKRLV